MEQNEIDQLKEELKYSIVMVTFRKSNGAEREMRCTINSDYLADLV